MRILIQQKNSGRYFKDIDAWTFEPEDARDFGTSAAAIDFCVLNTISDVQIILKFPRPEYDIVLPMIRQEDRPGHSPEAS